MTPRALLTAIGATALGFAAIIGTIAGSAATEEATAAAASSVPVQTEQTLAAAPAPWNEDCVIAL
jgi:hypothetical protein